MTLPDLEARFLPPEGWQEGYFGNPDTNHKIRFGYAQHSNPSGCILLLGGLSEFAEKYFETIHDLLARNLSVWTMDWAYQGLSTRNQDNQHKRHSDGFDADLSDLHFFIQNHILPQSPSLPMVMVGHSMGGHLGLRYLAQHPDMFKAAAFSAPMLGIKDLQIYGAAIKFLLRLLSPFHRGYIPGGSDWHEAMRKSDGNDIFSSDPVRDQVHNAWCLTNPALQVGAPTLGWLWESINSIHSLTPEALSKIKTPVLLTTAGKEKIVLNKAIKAAASHIPHASYLEIEGAKHEILMEKDEYRMQFFKAFDGLLKQVKITS